MTTVQPQESILRRRFIDGLIYSIPAVIGAALISSIGHYLFGKQTLQTDEWVDAGEISDLNNHVPRQIVFERTKTDGWEIRNQRSTAWVILSEQRAVTAFSPMCTHLGCAYRWEASQKNFSCPCHGSAFDVQGNVIKGPASRPLDRYTTKLEGNRLWLGPLKSSQGV